MSRPRSPNQALRKGFADENGLRNILLQQLVDRLNALRAELNELSATVDEYINDEAVTPAASSTDNAVVRFDGVDGRVLQNSVVTIDDDGNAIFPDGTYLGVSDDGAALTFDDASSRARFGGSHVDLSWNKLLCAGIILQGGGVYLPHECYVGSPSGPRISMDALSLEVDIFSADLDVNGNDILNVGNTTGTSGTLVTGTAGADGAMAVWDAGGNVVGGVLPESLSTKYWESWLKV